MGSLDDAKLQKRDDRSGRYSNAQDKANANRLGGLRSRQTRRKLAWSLIQAADLGVLVHRASSWGAALLFGVTRDGGALTLTVYLDGDKEVLYINDEDMIESTLDAVWQLFPERAHGDAGGSADIPF